jgi:hypothetical protein
VWRCFLLGSHSNAPLQAVTAKAVKKTLTVGSLYHKAKAIGTNIVTLKMTSSKPSNAAMTEKCIVLTTSIELVVA